MSISYSKVEKNLFESSPINKNSQDVVLAIEENNTLKFNTLENAVNRFSDRLWQYRVIAIVILGYSTFYMVRSNFSIIIPSLIESHGFNKTEIGFILSLFSIIYGFGKFISGYICDHLDPKWFLIIGLLGASIVNILIPLTNFSSFSILCVLWSLNGCFQSMGWPSCAKILTHCFNQREIGTIWGICNSAHGIGSGCIAIVGSYLLIRFGINSVFLIPSLFSLLMVLTIIWGFNKLPQIKDKFETKNNDSIIKRQQFLLKREILINPTIWCLCLSNLFIYVVRIGLVNWIPTYFVEYRGSSIGFAGWQFAGFEFFGILGGVVAGYMSDRVGMGFRPKVAIGFLLNLFICLLIFYYLPLNNSFFLTCTMVSAGFFIYGPQVLTGVVATDYVSKEIAATATGIIGTAGYIGSSLAGIGIGWIVDSFGWKAAFSMFLSSSLLSVLFFYISLKVGQKSLKNQRVGYDLVACG